MKNKQFVLVGNKKFFFKHRPFIKALCKSGAVDWRLDRNLDNDIPKGLIIDTEKLKYKPQPVFIKPTLFPIFRWETLWSNPAPNLLNPYGVLS